MTTRQLIFLLLATAPAVMAQAPVAQPVEEDEVPLQANPGEDFFNRCKQFYDAAKASSNRAQAQDFYRRAIPMFENYLEQFPEHANAQAAQYYLGESYYQIDFTDEAKRILADVVRKHREGRFVAAAAYRLGYDAYSQKQFGIAAKYFDIPAKTAADAKDRFRALYMQAYCYRADGNVGQAQRINKQIVDDPEAPVTYREAAQLALGHIFLEQKKYDLALPQFEALTGVQVEPDIRVEAAMHAGLVASKLKQDELAQKYYNMVMLFPKSKWMAQAQVALMNSQYQSKNYSEVLRTYAAGDLQGTASLRARQAMIAAKSAYQLKNYDLAIRTFIKVEQELPASELAFEANYMRLLCFYNMEGVNIPDQVDAFLEIYSHNYSNDEKIHKALLLKSETLFSERKFTQAAASYNAIRASKVGEANLASLYYKRGWCLSESRDFSGAVKNFTDFINKFPKDDRLPQAIAKRGEAYQHLSQDGAALRDFDMLVQKFPKSKLAALAWQNSARIKKEEQKFDEMVLRYERLLSDFPELGDETKANAYYWVGWGKYKLDDYQHALPALQQAKKMQPQTYGKQAGMLIVMCEYALKDRVGLKEAVLDVRELDLGEQVPKAVYRWLGVQCEKADELKDAELFLTLGVTPDEPRETPKAFWRLLGKSQVRNGNFEAALVSIDHFLEVADNGFWKAEALLDKSIALLGLSRVDDAEEIANQALAMKPSGRVNAELRLVLGDVAFARQDFEKAAGYYVVVVQLFVDDKDLKPKALYKSYQALSKKGDQAEAQRYLDDLKREFPDFKMD